MVFLGLEAKYCTGHTLEKSEHLDKFLRRLQITHQPFPNNLTGYEGVICRWWGQERLHSQTHRRLVTRGRDEKTPLNVHTKDHA